MSTATIDYDALAAQHGGTATVDYDALAAQHGGAAVQPTPQGTTPTIGAAAPRGVTGYLQDVERDLTEGGSRTIVGKAMGAMQGRGDQGYAGANAGVSPDQAQTMASLPIGLAKMATGASDMQHPVSGMLHAAGGALQASTLPTAFVAPDAVETAGAIAKAGGDAIAAKMLPSAMKEQAGGLLQSVAHDANQVPVQLQNAGDAALRLMDWQKKTQLGPTVNKFLNRITNPKLGPMTYEEARDFYQLLGKLSADETMKMAPPVKRDLVQMVVGLKQDIGNAADQVGQAANYYQGMKDYATGAKLQNWYDAAKDALTNEGVKGLIKGLGLGLGGTLGYEIYKRAQ